MVDPKLVKHFADFDAVLKKSKKEFESRLKADFQSNASLDDFKIMKTLGMGSFGRVVLVKHKKSDTLLAMKMLEKLHLVQQKQITHTIGEIRILDAVRFEFLVKMDYFFKDNVYLFLVMPFINGGELFMHLRRVKTFDETMCKFYAGQVVLAFEYLHNVGLVYRDLKPENILLDKDGYIKIIDFGFCKKVDEKRTYTLCGTPEYLAPEVIMSQGYNKSVDWWALGILIYEMNAGYPPFYAHEPMRIYEKIVSGKFQIPSHFSKPLKELLPNFLQVDRSKRIGTLKNGAKDVKGLNWFKSLDWEALLLRKIKPGYKPKLKGVDDTTNFNYYEEHPMKSCSIDEFAQEFANLNFK